MFVAGFFVPFSLLNAYLLTRGMNKEVLHFHNRLLIISSTIFSDYTMTECVCVCLCDVHQKSHYMVLVELSCNYLEHEHLEFLQ